ncbi:MAG: RidA family protein [Proteobacteria bacterium]|nr:RidA family protein [Pseudomonadota bacterium]MDA1356009.1 RidA family protein [Pseudomonadota bacterium]
MQILQPPGWRRPGGYSNGVASEGRLVFVAGLVGWDENSEFQSDDFISQTAQTLRNTVAVLAEAGAGPEHVTRMTWYIVDKQEYVTRQREMGDVYREIMGRNFPAMAMVAVSALMDDRAKVEIETTAVVPHVS